MLGKLILDNIIYTQICFSFFYFEKVYKFTPHLNMRDQPITLSINGFYLAQNLQQAPLIVASVLVGFYQCVSHLQKRDKLSAFDVGSQITRSLTGSQEVLKIRGQVVMWQHTTETRLWYQEPKPRSSFGIRDKPFFPKPIFFSISLMFSSLLGVI